MPKTSTPTLPSLAIETRTAQPRASRKMRAVEAALLIVAAIFLALHFLHLKADFPNHSFWKDWAKYTDEGWYGDAAIRHYQLGSWYLPGDFNPAAALPVWPAIEVVLFRFTGVSLVAGRALTVVVFGLSLVCCYLLLRRWTDKNDADVREPHSSLAPAATVALLAVSPFCFVFTRIAILEPMLILETLFALLVASWAGNSIANSNPSTQPSNSHIQLWTVLLGLLFPAMVLTKTTAVFLFPAILWTLWAATGYRLRASLRMAIPAAAIGAAVWGGYLALLVHRHYLIDYQYLFAANAYTGFKWKDAGDLFSNTIFDGIWIGKTLFALAIVAIIGAVVRIFAKGLRANPMQVTMLLWVVGYGAFLTYHANLQPRYYLVLAPPLTILVVVVFEPLLVSAARTWRPHALEPGETPAGKVDVFLLRAMAGIVAALLAFAGINAARQTLGFVLHSEYTWVNAIEQLREAIDREAAEGHLVEGGGRTGRGHTKMVLSISGANLSLMTGLPSICDDFGTMTLGDRIAKYKPGWFATWNEVEDDKMEALAPTYRLERVVAMPAFDDPDRNLLILYRLDPLATPGPAPVPGHRRTIFVPKSLRTKIGEQPSAEQLKH